MSLKGILYKVGSKIGYDPADSKQRQILLRLTNEAARELYAQSDMAGSLYEMVFKVNGDQTITLPSYVGYVRAIREYASQQAWHINQMRPRYNQFNWQDAWRNIRLKNKQALQCTVTNASVGVVSVPMVETTPITVTLTGPTSTATQISEEVIMTSLSVQSKNQFTDYVAVTKNVVTQYDVTLSDVDGKVLTVIPNTDFATVYQILDVSSCPWLSQNTSVLDNYMEILYKKSLKYMSDDGDEFPAIGYDDIIVNKVMQLYYEEQNKPDNAIGYDTKATRSLARLHEEQNRETEDMVALVANPHDTMMRRIGGGLRRRFSLWGGRRY